MSEKIVSKIHSYGNEKEAEWPPKYGTASIFEENRVVFSRAEKPKKDVNAPAVIPDEMPPTEFLGNANREMYTSKRKLEQRNQRCRDENPELAKAPEPLRYPSEREIRDTTEKAYMDIKYNKIPVSEKERAIYTEEERKWKHYERNQR